MIPFFKEARTLNMSDVEDNIGTYFGDEDEPVVRQMITQQYNKRLPLRHPIMTGIPTLGMAPALSKYKAINEITRQLARKDARHATALQKHQETMRQHREAMAQAEAIQAAANTMSRTPYFQSPRG